MSDSPAEYTIFIDNECPLCRREVRFMRWLDRRNRVRFVDISSPEFDEQRWGRSYDELMAEIHGQLADGSWQTGVEVFRSVYRLLGFGWLVSATRLPGVSHMLNAGYDVFARNRVRWFGRPDAECQDACPARLRPSEAATDVPVEAT